MAAGDAPDLVFTYDAVTFTKYAQAGGLTALDDVLAQYGQDFMALTGEETQKYGKVDGVPYEAMGGRTGGIGMGAALMRKDRLVAVGMEAPTNTQQLYQVLNACRDQDPGGFGEAAIPWAISLLPEMQRGYWTMGYSFYEWDQIDDKMWNTSFDLSNILFFLLISQRPLFDKRFLIKQGTLFVMMGINILEDRGGAKG